MVCDDPQNANDFPQDLYQRRADHTSGHSTPCCLHLNYTWSVVGQHTAALHAWPLMYTGQGRGGLHDTALCTCSDCKTILTSSPEPQSLVWKLTVRLVDNYSLSLHTYTLRQLTLKHGPHSFTH